MHQPAKHITDSPWFWGVLFLCGGLVILTIAAPRIQQRQRRLDLQFRARQAAGQSVLHDGNPPAGEALPEGTLVPVRPLMLALLVAMLASSGMLWLTHARQTGHDKGTSDPRAPRPRP